DTDLEKRASGRACHLRSAQRSRVTVAPQLASRQSDASAASISSRRRNILKARGFGMIHASAVMLSIASASVLGLVAGVEAALTPDTAASHQQHQPHAPH